MDTVNIQLESGRYYHIYNRGVNSCALFKTYENYNYFLKLYNKHLSDIIGTYAWALMPNHFHFLVRLKDDIADEIITSDRFNSKSYMKLVRYDKKIHQYFSNLFNAYSKAFNKQESRHGTLFERPFRKKQANSKNYLIQVLLYIHNNPVRHGFVKKIEDYKWSSYQSYFSKQEIELDIKEAISWFDDLENLMYIHRKKANNLDFDI